MKEDIYGLAAREGKREKGLEDSSWGQLGRDLFLEDDGLERKETFVTKFDDFGPKSQNSF